MSDRKYVFKLEVTTPDMVVLPMKVEASEELFKDLKEVYGIDPLEEFMALVTSQFTEEMRRHELK